MAAITSSAPSGEDAVEPADPPRRQVPGWYWPLGVGALAALMRAWLVADRVAYSNRDEMRYLAVARMLAGEVDWYLEGGTFSPGYPTLVAPIHWLTSDPATVQRFALALNALLGGLLAALLVLLARRMTRLSAPWCAAAALLTASVPGAFLQSNWAAPETLMAAILVAVVLASSHLIDRPRFTTGLVIVVLAPFGYLAHGRFVPLVVSAAVLIGWLAYQRRLPVAQAGALVAVLGILTLAAQRYTYWAIDVTWIETKSASRVDSVLEQVREPARIARTTLGMTWYQLVTTLGATGLGAWVTAAGLGRLRAAAPTGLGRRDSAVVIVYTVPLAALTTVFMAGAGTAERPQQVAHMVYGRYWEAFVAPLVLLGLLYVVSAGRGALRRSIGVLLAVTAGSALLLVAVRGDDITEATARNGGLGIGRRIVGLVPFLRDRTELPVFEITLIALVMMAIAYAPVLLLRGAVAARAVTLAILAVFTVVGIAMGDRYLDPGVPDPDRLDAISVPFESGVVPPGSTVHFTGNGLGRVWFRYQSEVTDFALPRFDPADPDRPDYLVGRRREPVMRRWGAEVVWEDPYSNVVIWAVPPGE